MPRSERGHAAPRVGPEPGLLNPAALLVTYLLSQLAFPIIAAVYVALMPGSQLGPYEVAALIGRGGMGEVYKARDVRLDRTVAIKILPAALADDPARRVRFEREARAVAALNHPHICTLYDVGPNYLVMEMVDGQPLAGPLPLARVLEFASQILSALDAAHRKGITHRDLKPGNILMTKQGDQAPRLRIGQAGYQWGCHLYGSDPDSCAVRIAYGAADADGRAHDPGDGALHVSGAGPRQARRSAQ